MTGHLSKRAMSRRERIGVNVVERGAHFVEAMDREEAHYSNPCWVRVVDTKDDEAHVKCINGGFDEAWWPIARLENRLRWRRER